MMKWTLEIGVTNIQFQIVEQAEEKITTCMYAVNKIMNKIMCCLYIMY